MEQLSYLSTFYFGFESSNPNLYAISRSVTKNRKTKSIQIKLLVGFKIMERTKLKIKFGWKKNVKNWKSN